MYAFIRRAAEEHVSAETWASPPRTSNTTGGMSNLMDRIEAISTIAARRQSEL
jgi:hypothetical protein